MCEVCVELEEMPFGKLDGYIPVPCWNGTEWEPVAVALGGKRMCWPQGFSPQDLPKPKYCLGDAVAYPQFPFLDGKIWQTGYVQHIRLRGGGYFNFEGTAPEICLAYYQRPFMAYKVYANGHEHWVEEWAIRLVRGSTGGRVR